MFILFWLSFPSHSFDLFLTFVNDLLVYRGHEYDAHGKCSIDLTRWRPMSKLAKAGSMRTRSLHLLIIRSWNGQTRLLFQSSNTRFWTKYIKTSFAGPHGLKRLSLSSRRTFSEAPKPLWLGLTSSHRWIPSTASVFIPSVNSSKYHNSTYLLSIHPIVTIELSST